MGRNILKTIFWIQRRSFRLFESNRTDMTWRSGSCSLPPTTPACASWGGSGQLWDTWRHLRKREVSNYRRCALRWALKCSDGVNGCSYPRGTHRPRSEIKYQQKNLWGEVLNFSFLKIIRRLLLFARLSYYFTPYNRLTDYSQQVHKLTKSSTLLSFWPAGFILPPIIENLLIYFFQYRPFGRGVECARTP